MHCEQVQKLWQAYADETTDSVVTGAMTAHIEGCEGCRAFDHEMRRLEYNLEVLSDQSPEPSAFLTTRIMANIQEARERRRGLSDILAWLTLPRLAMAAMVAVAFFAGTLTSHFSPVDAIDTGAVAMRKVVLEYDGVSSDQVDLVGDFNEWGRKEVPIQSHMVDGRWVFELELTPGRYQYTFVIDGKKWLPDLSATGIIPDGFGGMNSLLYVNGNEGI
jgi:predicted anti-sigma-YlaC factor YlaD